MSILLKNLKNDHLICHSVSYPEILAMYAPDSKKGTYLQIPQCSIKDGSGNYFEEHKNSDIGIIKNFNINK